MTDPFLGFMHQHAGHGLRIDSLGQHYVQRSRLVIV
jgi:hypothetical protein